MFFFFVKVVSDGHFSFGLFLVNFIVCSEPLSQSRVASITMDVDSLTFLTNDAFFFVFALRHIHSNE